MDNTQQQSLSHLAPGSYYSLSWRDDGLYEVAKVLASDEGGVHLRIYREAFEDRPISVTPAILHVEPDENGSHGFGHLPFTLELFRSYDPQFIQFGAVADNELDGYAVWKADPNAGYFSNASELASLSL